MAQTGDSTVTLSSAVELSPSAAALRMRHHRERRRKGLFCLVLEVRFTEIDVRELRRKGILGDERIAIGPSLRWPRIARMQVAKYRIIIQRWKQITSQHSSSRGRGAISAGLRPLMHCPGCEKRVAKLYNGLAGYFCRACLGNPIYASQGKSSQGRQHFKACKLRLRLNGEAFLTKPFPDRPRGMHKRTYDRLSRGGMQLEADLSRRIKRKTPDYPNLVAYQTSEVGEIPIDLGDLPFWRPCASREDTNARHNRHDN